MFNEIIIIKQRKHNISKKVKKIASKTRNMESITNNICNSWMAFVFSIMAILLCHEL